MVLKKEIALKFRLDLNIYTCIYPTVQVRHVQVIQYIFEIKKKMSEFSKINFQHVSYIHQESK